jgi:hypothetical protein
MCPACIQSYVANATVIGGIVAAVLNKLKKLKVKEKGDAAAKSRV